MKHLLAILFLLPLVALGQVEVRRYATMTELLSANPSAFAVAGRATVVVTGRTNFYDGWSRVLSYSSSDTNAADNSTIFAPANTNFVGRYRLLYLENPTNSNVRAGVLPPWQTNAFWYNGAWKTLSTNFVGGTNMSVSYSGGVWTFNSSGGSGGSGTPLIATVDDLTFTNLNLASFGDLYWSVPDNTNLYAQLYPNAVDYDEIQQVSGQRLLGNPSGSAANVSEISIGANLALSGGGVLSATVPVGTNSYQISVDGVVVNTPDLVDSAEIDPDASGSSISMSINSGSVALSKLSSISASRLVGRGSSGSGSPEQITLGTGLSMSGTSINPAVSSFSANGTAISAPNILSAAEISASISSLTNVYMSLNPGSVVLSKLVDVSSGTLLGRGATGTGSVSQITLGTGLALTTNGVLSATGTNTTLVRVGGTAVTGPNFLDTSELDWYIDLSTNISVDLFPASVVFSKLQNVATSRLLGRSTSGSGSIEQIQIGSGLTLSSGTLSATGGGGGTNGTAVYVDGVSISNPNFTDASTTGLFDVSGTNITIRLPDRDFGAVTVSGSGTAINYDTGSISSNHIASGQVSQDKLGTSGTGTSTNFLAGDYTYKQVTTNMIPGLNAVLATIGTGGSGGGTNIKVNGTLVSNANLVNSSTVLANVSGSDISFTVTNVAGSTTSNVLQRTGYAEFTLDTGYSITGLTMSGAITNVSIAAGGASTRGYYEVALSPARSGTNYVVVVDIEAEDPTGLGSPLGAVVFDTRTTTSFDFVTRFTDSERAPNGVKHLVWILEPVTVGGSGGSGGSGTVTSVAASSSVGGLSFSGTPITTYGTLSLTGVVDVASGGTGATDAGMARTNLGVPSSKWLANFGDPSDFSYGTGTHYVNLSSYQVWEQTDSNEWSQITSFIMGAGVYQPINTYLTAMANGAAVALAQTNSVSVSAPLLIAGSSATIGGTNVLTFAASHLTESEASALYQATNANLTTLAGASITGSGNFMRTRTGVPRSLYIGANAWNPTANGPTASTNVWGTTTDGHTMETWDFSATSTNELNWTYALPEEWNGSTVKAKIHWKQVAAEASSTNRWAIGGGSIGPGETGGNTLGTLVMVTSVGANDTNVVTTTAASDAITLGGSPSSGHLTWFTVRRHPGDSLDNSSVQSRLIGVTIQMVESATETTPW